MASSIHWPHPARYRACGDLAQELACGKGKPGLDEGQPEDGEFQGHKIPPLARPGIRAIEPLHVIDAFKISRMSSLNICHL